MTHFTPGSYLGIHTGRIEKLNVVIGQNNTGKSNLIRAFQLISQLNRSGIGGKVDLGPLDIYNLDQKNEILIDLEFDFPEGAEFDDFREEFDYIRFKYLIQHNGI